jgi:amino acid transporter
LSRHLSLTDPMSNPLQRAKRLLVGRPLATERLDNERLTKTTALAVLSSDAISSVAYATDEILYVLAPLGAAALTFVFPISAVIVGLLALVALSYRQTIFAYPGGGGSFTVAYENLGVMPGLTAAAALLTDYILTVSVSISSGIAAITSAYPALAPRTVPMCVGAIIVLMLVNLRGVRESGAAFSLPTYAFIIAMLALIGTGCTQLFFGTAHIPAASATAAATGATSGGFPMGFAYTFLMLRAFSGGCVAMTGTEAISNGVGAFKRPSSRNAAVTLGWMATILGVFFLGSSFLTQHLRILPLAGETVLSQLGHRIFGGGAMYYALQYSTFAVLVLAANTSFADFPRLGSILANQRYLPRQLSARGDRLAFSNGIVALALVAIVLVWAFRGDTTALIPLYAIGVFLCFTLSQAGMVRRWLTTRAEGWRWKAMLNGVGAVATGVVAVIQVWTKFTHGAWIVVVIIPLFILLLRGIKRHYVRFASEIQLDGTTEMVPLHHHVVVPVSGVHKAVANALIYASAISDDVRAVYVEVEPDKTSALKRDWDAWDTGIDLTILPSPYRSLIRPLVDYVSELESAGPGDLTTVVVPEIVPKHWYEHLLHNKTALYIRTAFLFRPRIVVTTVAFHLGTAHRLRDLLEHDDQVDERSDGEGLAVADTRAEYPQPVPVRTATP